MLVNSLREPADARILVENGMVVDGAGNPWFRADVLIEGGRTAKVGRIGDVEVDSKLDASGLVVCPGFIDIHSHSDYTLLVNRHADSKIRQGITTEVVGNCGHSAAPLIGEAREEAKRGAEAYELGIDWQSMAEYLEKLEKNKVSLNVASHVGFGTVKLCVTGHEAGDPTDEELERMKELVSKSIAEGAVGISTGLRYAPQSYAKTEEVIAVATAAREKGGIYASHVRDEGDRGHPLEAMEEAIEIGREAKIPIHVSHLKILAKPLWGLCDQMLEMIQRAREEGVEITADQYPYDASGTGLLAWIPKWAREGGNAKLVERLDDPDTREKIMEEFSRVVEVRGGAERALISRFRPDPSLEGKNVAEVAKQWGVPEIEAALKLVRMAAESEKGIGIANFNQSAENVAKIMMKPWVMVGTDGYALKPEGVLGRGVPHPRSYGTYPRVLRKYVREEAVIRLEDAIRKMTSLPAQKLGLLDRGLLREGFWADIVVFDPREAADTATFTDPHRYPKGMEYVIVNGEVVIDRGEHTSATPGTVLRETYRKTGTTA